ncbi:hypothetical protein QQ045_012113 [Rhodiola kirilowii]
MAPIAPKVRISNPTNRYKLAMSVQEKAEREAEEAARPLQRTIDEVYAEVRAMRAELRNVTRAQREIMAYMRAHPQNQNQPQT